MYSVRKKDGTWEDVVFRGRMKASGSTWYSVFLGDEKIGQVMSGRLGWTALSYNHEKPVRHLNMIPGFQSRWKAMEYILEHQGYPRTVRDDDEERVAKFVYKRNMGRAAAILARSSFADSML